jgi:hypothetical protein
LELNLKQDELLTWLFRAACSDSNTGGGRGGGGGYESLSSVLAGCAVVLQGLMFRGLLRFELLGMFAAFVVCIGLALQRGRN